MWSCEETEIISIDSGGVVTARMKGSSSVRATDAANSLHYGTAAVSVIMTFVIILFTVTISYCTSCIRYMYSLLPVLGTCSSFYPLLPVLGACSSFYPLLPVLGTCSSFYPLLTVLGTCNSSSED